MDIGPVSNRPPEHQPSKKSPNNKAPEEFQTSRAEDRVEISLEARQRLSELADKVRNSGLDTLNAGVEGPGGQKRTDDDIPQKAGSLDEIRKRIESGYYDRSDVRDQIADKMSDDLES